LCDGGKDNDEFDLIKTDVHFSLYCSLLAPTVNVSRGALNYLKQEDILAALGRRTIVKNWLDDKKY
jgi:hypothetical protein